MDQPALYAFLARHRYAVISSLSATGAPQSALIGIAVTPALEIVFDTVRSSRKYPNLIARPRCSLVIGLAGGEPPGEQTVQFEGIASSPAGPELQRIQHAYFAAWPDGPARVNWPEIVYFVVRPLWIRFSDYGQNPPLIEECTFPAAAVSGL